MGDARGMRTLRKGHYLATGLVCWMAFSSAALAVEVTGRGYPVRPASVSPAAPAAVAGAGAGAGAVTAEPAQPAVAAADYENQPLAFSNSGNRRQLRGEGEYRMPSIWPALLCVIVVCAVFCGILYCAKKYLPGHRQLFSHPAMEILGRTHLDQRRYVSLLRVGKRIVVIGVSPDEMRSLSEITDEEEITGIMEVARPKSEAGLNIFQRLFQRNVQQHEAAETRAIANARTAELEEQMSSLRQRVRAIRETEEPARHVDAVG